MRPQLSRRLSAIAVADNLQRPRSRELNAQSGAASLLPPRPLMEGPMRRTQGIRVAAPLPSHASSPRGGSVKTSPARTSKAPAAERHAAPLSATGGAGGGAALRARLTDQRASDRLRNREPGDMHHQGGYYRDPPRAVCTSELSSPNYHRLRRFWVPFCHPAPNSNRARP